MTKPPVKIRMYTGILGDCFLLTIGAGDRAERAHILIDCGILQQSPNEAKLIQAVAKDIFAVTGGRLDLLIITHEHWDHISGFNHARDLLINEMQIDNLWLAWTERRGDTQADALRPVLEKAKKTVATAAEKAKALGADVTANIQHFNGPFTPGTGRLSSTEIIPELIAKAEATGAVKYLEPGEVKLTPGPASLRAHVLGPPRNAAKLTKSTPSGGSDKETYLAGAFELSLNERYAISSSLDDAMDSDGTTPFARRFGIENSEVTETSVDQTHKWLWKRYRSESEAWRNIDYSWLEAAGSLALKLDSDTNNTSLVLAFETEPGGDVLLFAADAQVGNWLSWHDQTYEPPIIGATPVTAADLLRRTKVYKVGHHASHNATLDKLGLSLMTHPQLVALIPVVEAEARREKNGKAVHRGWNMPYPALLDQLMEKTRGRILRGDAVPGQDPAKKTICADAEFLGRVTSDPLFVEYSVS